MTVIFDLGKFVNDAYDITKTIVFSIIPAALVALAVLFYIFNPIWIPILLAQDEKLSPEYLSLFILFLCYLFGHVGYLVFILDLERERVFSEKGVKTHARLLVEHSTFFKIVFGIAAIGTPLIVNYILCSAAINRVDLRYFSTFCSYLFSAGFWILSLQGGFLVLCYYTRIENELCTEKKKEN